MRKLSEIRKLISKSRGPKKASIAGLDINPEKISVAFEGIEYSIPTPGGIFSNGIIVGKQPFVL